MDLFSTFVQWGNDSMRGFLKSLCVCLSVCVSPSLPLSFHWCFFPPEIELGEEDGTVIGLMGWKVGLGISSHCLSRCLKYNVCVLGGCHSVYIALGVFGLQGLF